MEQHLWIVSRFDSVTQQHVVCIYVIGPGLPRCVFVPATMSDVPGDIPLCPLACVQQTCKQFDQDTCICIHKDCACCGRLLLWRFCYGMLWTACVPMARAPDGAWSVGPSSGIGGSAGPGLAAGQAPVGAVLLSGWTCMPMSKDNFRRGTNKQAPTCNFNR